MRKRTKHCSFLQVSEIIRHPKYAGLVAVRYDVAVLRLDGALDFVNSGGTVAPVCLPRRSHNVKGEVTITGWGRTKEGEPNVFFNTFFLIIVLENPSQSISHGFAGIRTKCHLIKSF